MPLITWSETRFWDPNTGEDAITFSGFSGHGTYFIRAPLAPPGKSRRAQKEEILDWIEAAIDAEAEPGEVTAEKTQAALVQKQERDRLREALVQSIKPPPRMEVS